jgi:hypothetical protein
VLGRSRLRKRAERVGFIGALEHLAGRSRRAVSWRRNSIELCRFVNLIIVAPIGDLMGRAARVCRALLMPAKEAPGENGREAANKRPRRSQSSREKSGN